MLIWFSNIWEAWDGEKCFHGCCVKVGLDFLPVYNYISIEMPIKWSLLGECKIPCVTVRKSLEAQKRITD